MKQIWTPLLDPYPTGLPGVPKTHRWVRWSHRCTFILWRGSPLAREAYRTEINYASSVGRQSREGLKPTCIVPSPRSSILPLWEVGLPPSPPHPPPHTIITIYIFLSFIEIQFIYSVMFLLYRRVNHPYVQTNPLCFFSFSLPCRSPRSTNRLSYPMQ